MARRKRTVYEYAVTFAVVAITVSLAVALYAGRAKVRKGNLLIQELSMLRSGVQVYQLVNRKNPPSLAELVTSTYESGSSRRNYVQHLPMDSEGRVIYIEKVPEKLPDAEGHLNFSRFSRYLEARGKDNIGQIRDAMRTLMTENVSIFRTEKGISETIDALKELKERADKTALSSKSLNMNQELVQHWELDNLLAVSMVIAEAALNRRESRGAHFRDDFPERKDEFNYHTLTSMEQFGKVELGKRKVDMSLFEARGPSYEKFGIIERKY